MSGDRNGPALAATIEALTEIGLVYDRRDFDEIGDPHAFSSGIPSPVAPRVRVVEEGETLPEDAS